MIEHATGKPQRVITSRLSTACENACQPRTRFGADLESEAKGESADSNWSVLDAEQSSIAGAGKAGRPVPTWLTAQPARRLHHALPVSEIFLLKLPLAGTRREL